MITRLVLTPAVRDDLFAHARVGTATAESADRSATDRSTADRSATDRSTADRSATDRSATDPTVAEEVCGVLAGDRRSDDSADSDGETAVVTTCRRVPNVAERPGHRYELDPAATVTAIEALEADGLDHVGFYHSHPRGPRGPSATDQAQATWPGYVYLIVSLGVGTADSESEPAIGAWRWTGESFVQLPIVVEDPDHG